MSADVSTDESADESTGVATALRLGWAFAQVRGRHWPDGPRPRSSVLPEVPADVLPLRSQRGSEDSRRESAGTLLSLVHALDLPNGGEIAAALALGDDGRIATDWPDLARRLRTWDAAYQDELTRRDEQLANAYLLGRGIAECYWGLGPDETWLTTDGRRTGASLEFLLGDDRRQELTRMLGRLGPDVIHPFSGAAISGSLEAWGRVAADPSWSSDPELRARLYEQVRQWYQLLILQQDPTTLIRPYARLTSPRTLARALRAFWPQVLLALVALGLTVAFVSVVGNPGETVLSPLLATGGFGAFAAAGLLARGQSAAQRMVTRMRQDAYTDLVAISVAIVPDWPGRRGRPSSRSAARRVESAVRDRLLTPPTAPPPS